MPALLKSLRAWRSNNFAEVLKDELEHLPTGALPLTQGLAQGGLVDDSDISATILSFSDNETAIEAKVGIFFTEIVINCGCGDDPFETNAYCEMHLNIDKSSGHTEIEVLKD